MFDHIKANQELVKAQIANTFEKSEGSRGGHIIGHTKSGKPIYGVTADNHAHTPKGHYDSFSKEDHSDAVDVHATAAFKEKDNDRKKRAHRGRAEWHQGEADNFTSSSEMDNEEYIKKRDHHLEEAKAAKEDGRDMEAKTHQNHADFHDSKIKKSEIDEVLDLLIKGGETKAEKKAKKIGKTKSGKDIYDDHDDDNHKEFSSSDHRDAADLFHTMAGDSKNGFPGTTRSQRNKHLDSVVAKSKEEEKNKLKSAPAAGDRITSSDGTGGDVKHRDETHTYLEYEGEEKGTTKITKVANEDVDNKITVGHYKHHKLTNMKKSESIDDAFDELIKSGIDELEKGAKGGGAAIGTIKTMGDREYIKASDGTWKYHGKGKGSPAAEPATPKEKSISDKISEERMGDINFRFKAFAAAAKGVITGKFKSCIAYGTGGVGKTYTVTGQLAAAGKRPFDDEEMRPGSDDYDYVKITGKMTAPQVYKTLFEHNGKILLFDDCDSVLTDGSSINLFKGALDSSGDGTIQYATSSGVKMEDADGETVKVPNRFKFNGRCIFISNLPSASMPQPLKSRAVGIDLSMDKKQTLDRIKQIAQDPKTKQLTNLQFPGIDKYAHEHMSEVIDYLDGIKEHVGDLNVRTVGKVLGLHQIAHEMGEGKDWRIC
jgi:hypothetical protein